MILVVIPARYASTRFPGKPLVSIAGKTMIQRVYEQVRLAPLVDQIVVATDDQRIFDHVRAFGGEVRMTDAAHPSGTDRCAEVALQFPEADLILNIQGDEPFIQPEQIAGLIEVLQGAETGIATLAKSITDAALLSNPNVVKVVKSLSNRALYFSRHPAPFVRSMPESEWVTAGLHYKHIGLYGFHRDTLLAITRLPPSPLELAESLEQLRWLENGYPITVGITQLETIGIDSPEDLERLSFV